MDYTGGTCEYFAVSKKGLQAQWGSCIFDTSRFLMKAQGIPDFHAPPPIPTFIDTSHAIDELPEYDAFEPAPDDL